MTGIEIYRLVLDTFTAVGTVGAVWVSLWVVLRKPRPFSIRNIEMETSIILDENRKEKERQHFLIVKLENHQDVRMHVFSLAVNAENDNKKDGVVGGGNIFPLNEIFIPEKSTYNIRQPISSDWERGTFSEANKITCTVSTSFGDKTIVFPKDWRQRLYEAVEKPKEKRA